MFHGEGIARRPLRPDRGGIMCYEVWRAVVIGAGVAAAAMATLFVLSTRGGEGRQPAPPGLPVGTAAPPYVLTAARETVTPKQFAGRSVVLAFVTSDCRTCAADLRLVGSLAPHVLGSAGERTSYVVIDRGRRGPGRIQQYARSVGVSIGPLFTSDPTGAAWHAYRVAAPGTFFVIGADGNVAWRGVDPAASILHAQIRRAAALVHLP